MVSGGATGPGRGVGEIGGGDGAVEKTIEKTGTPVILTFVVALMGLTLEK